MSHKVNIITDPGLTPGYLFETHLVQDIQCPLQHVSRGSHLETIAVHPLAEFNEDFNFQIVVLLVLLLGKSKKKSQITKQKEHKVKEKIIT